LIGGAAQFRVLNPQIRLHLLHGAQERQYCNIAAVQRRAVVRKAFPFRKQSRPNRRPERSGLQKRSSVSISLESPSKILHIQLLLD
jgi:hypothetical protein